MVRTIVAAAKWLVIVVATIVVVLLVGLVAVPPTTRWFTDSWGATPAEVSAVMPGDNLFPATARSPRRPSPSTPHRSSRLRPNPADGPAQGRLYGWDWFYRATGSADFVDGPLLDEDSFPNCNT